MTTTTIVASLLVVLMSTASSVRNWAKVSEIERLLHPPPIPPNNMPKSCYDQQGKAQRCIPPFVNAAFDMEVEATNTCGSPPIEYCRQTGATGATKECDICDARDTSRSHPPRFLTDVWNENENQTWWQSTTMKQGVDEQPVNLTLDLHKTFEITYVRLRFRTSVPESFAIYKKNCDDCPWVPYQYYSASCESTYGVRRRGYVTRANEKVAICTDEFSDISPLANANVPFSTLESRPSRERFSESLELQNWVTATAIRISLKKLNTFGDEVYRDDKVLRTYYYAISDLSVGGRCKCNGHASHCVMSTGQGQASRLVCQCEHHTTGADCGECLPFYQDLPWRKATDRDAHACRSCECNGLSSRCVFDDDLFRRTQSGGRCLDCEKNTAGPHCEDCKTGYYREERTSECVPCGCDGLGSLNSRCDDSGRCSCRVGVAGIKCDQCLPQHFAFSAQGCRPCSCDERGSLNSNPSCDVITGKCRCKDNVEGDRCDRCKPGFFNLQTNNEFGCSSCFCFGHSSACESAPEFFRRIIHSDFRSSEDGWTLTQGGDDKLLWNQANQELTHRRRNSAQRASLSNAYFVASAPFRGDQRFSYNHFLTFRFRITDGRPQASRNDIIIKGKRHTISIPIFEQGNSMPTTEMKEYSFRLHEHPNYRWSPRLSSMQFQDLLSEITNLEIRATYSNEGVGVVDDVILQSAGFRAGDKPAKHVEKCHCPKGYVGQFCEDCAPGFRRDTNDGGRLSSCVPCTCNGHSTSCDVATGRCICEHNTEGDGCDRCALGYIGDARRGQPNDCHPCPCPVGTSCMRGAGGEDVVCTGCPNGHVGPRCTMCGEGFYGDLSDCDSRDIGRRDGSGDNNDNHHLHPYHCTCRPCSCNNNIDANAVGNCDVNTGICLKCIHGTHGHHCERCLPGHYGVAIIPGRQANCTRCDCHPRGTKKSIDDMCDRDGNCPCFDNVEGKKCDQPKPGFRWKPDNDDDDGSKDGVNPPPSSTIVIPCNCDVVGALGIDCSPDGQCLCKPGVTGKKCDRCSPGFFDLSSSNDNGGGCRPCGCDPVGSITASCDARGRCVCLSEDVIGDKCDKCRENMFGLSRATRGQCFACPVCYDLVDDRVNAHRLTLERLKNVLVADDGGGRRDLAEVNVTDEQMDKLVADVNATMTLLHRQAVALGSGSGFRSFDSDISAMRLSLTRQKTLSARANQLSLHESRLVQEAADEIDNLVANLDDRLDALKDLLEDARQVESDQEGLPSLTNELMSQAQAAAGLAERLSNSATTIVDTAEKSTYLSRDARRRLRESLSRLQSLGDDLASLRRDAEILRSEFDRNAEKASGNRRRAEMVMEEISQIAEELKGYQPGISEAVHERITETKKNATKIRKASTDLRNDNQKILLAVNKSREDGLRTFALALQAQQALDELLESAVDAQVKAEFARDLIKPPKGVLGEAQKTLETLSDFDNTVTTSMKETERALSRTNSIVDALDNVDATLRQIEIKWRRNRTFNITDRAANASKETFGLSSILSLNATSLSAETLATQNTASDVKSRAEKLMSYEFQATETQILDMEATTMADSKRADDSVTLWEQSYRDGSLSLFKADDTLFRLQRIFDDLSRLENPTNVDMDVLLRDFEQAENTIKDLGLEETIARYEIGALQQREFMAKLASEMQSLEEQTVHVERILETLPPPIRSECPQLLELESSRRK